jgi:hypothetical protein
LDDYSFFEGATPTGYKLSFNPCIFNSGGYLNLVTRYSSTSFCIVNEKTKEIVSQIHFHLDKSTACSLMQSPFGSFEFSSDLPAPRLFEFIQFVERQLKVNGVSTIIIKNPPALYQPEKAALIHTFLVNQGFQIHEAEITSVIHPGVNGFADIIHPRKKRKLRQSEETGFQFRTLEAQQLDEVYHFIERCRDEKKFKLSVTLEHLKKAMSLLTGTYFLFGVYHKQVLVGASVLVRVNEQIMYHFISDHVRKVEAAKPVLILMKGIYDYCVAHGIKLLDLGTSALGSKPNFRLLKFKTELGGIASPKFTFSKDLS